MRVLSMVGYAALVDCVALVALTVASNFGAPANWCTRVGGTASAGRRHASPVRPVRGAPGRGTYFAFLAFFALFAAGLADFVAAGLLAADIFAPVPQPFDPLMLPHPLAMVFSYPTRDE